jgi:excisionase family DNA binding protein
LAAQVATVGDFMDWESLMTILEMPKWDETECSVERRKNLYVRKNASVKSKFVFYTTHEVADILRRSYYTISEWVRDGVIDAQPVGREYLISEDSLMAFLKGEKERHGKRKKTVRFPR